MFLFTLIFLIGLCTALWICIKWYKMKTFWAKKGVPHCEVHPIFGSLTFLQRINPGTWMRQIYEQYKSPYVGIWVFWRPGLIINCPRLARNILVKDADVFKNRLLGTGTKDDVGTQNLFTVNDPLWSSLRRRLTSIFTAAKLRSWEDLFRSKSADLVHRIKSDSEKGIRNNLRPLYADYTTDVIGESAFGIKCEATKNNGGPLRGMTKEFEKYSRFRGIEWSSIFFFPELADLLGFTFWPIHTSVWFKKVFNMIVQERGGYDEKTDGKRDLMDAFLKMKQDSMKDDQNLDEVIVISNAMIFLQGGYDTSSSALSYITYELAYNPQYQERMYDELIEMKRKIGDRPYEGSDLAELSYLWNLWNQIISNFLCNFSFTFWPIHTSVWFKKVFNMIVQERGGYDEKTDGKRDLMDAFLKMKQDSMKDDQNLDEVIVISNAMIFLQGGYDTSSSALSYITYELAYNPQYQERMYDELIEMKRKIGDRPYEGSDLAELSYLNAVIKETLRKYPIMGWIDRLALTDYIVDDYLTIPAGTVTYVNANGMHYDPKHFPEPEIFRPERFLPENEKNIIPYSYMPFGEGPRSCIGEPMSVEFIARN